MPVLGVFSPQSSRAARAPTPTVLPLPPDVTPLLTLAPSLIPPFAPPRSLMQGLNPLDWVEALTDGPPLLLVSLAVSAAAGAVLWAGGRGDRRAYYAVFSFAWAALLTVAIAVFVRLVTAGMMSVLQPLAAMQRPGELWSAPATPSPPAPSLPPPEGHLPDSATVQNALAAAMSAV